MNSLRKFLSDDAGAVTVDWVVLTAAIVGLAFVALTPIFTGTKSISSAVSTKVTTSKVGF